MTEPASPVESAAANPPPRPPVPWPVLREMFSLLRRHWLRIAIFTVVIALSSAVIAVVMASVQYWCDCSVIADPLLTYYALLVVAAMLVAFTGPLEGGYYLALYRLRVGEEAGARTLIVGYGSGWQLRHLVAGSFVLTACQYALSELWVYLPWGFCWEYFSNIVPPDSPLGQMLLTLLRISAVVLLINGFHFAARALILLPLQWVLVEIIVTGKSWPKSLAGSAGLVWRHRRLALAYLGVEVALFFNIGLRALLPHARDYVQDHSDFMFHLVDSVQLAGNAAITCAVTAIEAVALVVVYCAMREAATLAAVPAAQPPESA